MQCLKINKNIISTFSFKNLTFSVKVLFFYRLYLEKLGFSELLSIHGPAGLAVIHGHSAFLSRRPKVSQISVTGGHSDPKF